ncbi:hypothetical protein [Actinomyces glycerinitolerans]|uniref:Uncharacterized protein n=1 Tax=Actinomyces glycerinitolerans TaxID=1892869 RepID=A0A1M4RZ05_9ACTO|nr:hypothetical protein [Actinomyces glycerinitolerans]SHE25213.1 Hypothetical protein ACGLYG10_1429 [Actinomyces glycerinitolerans]
MSSRDSESRPHSAPVPPTAAQPALPEGEGPDDAVIDAYEQLTTGDIQQADDVPTYASHEEIAEKVDQLEVDRRAQANELRYEFFDFGVKSAYVCVLTSAGVSTWMAATDKMTDTIAVAFITGLAVEVLGITAIIAKYLFPDKQKEDAERDGTSAKRRYGGLLRGE